MRDDAVAGVLERRDDGLDMSECMPCAGTQDETGSSAREMEPLSCGRLLLIQR